MEESEGRKEEKPFMRKKFSLSASCDLHWSQDTHWRIQRVATSV